MHDFPVGRKYPTGNGVRLSGKLKLRTGFLQKQAENARNESLNYLDRVELKSWNTVNGQCP